MYKSKLYKIDKTLLYLSVDTYCCIVFQTPGKLTMTLLLPCVFIVVATVVFQVSLILAV